ncbi:hypothetical protein [Acidovorax sp. PRC11]|uniref:hypothetical protein n=1 Tax=Acidovorax sp. PRC11 TaxID=2962592 RepID=UPI00288215AC|nr:hypothetical protein [Acidovorax sp. PRC11]MDT0136819.1 hypothetical protein [Acidovorax sp. PRC11]
MQALALSALNSTDFRGLAKAFDHTAMESFGCHIAKAEAGTRNESDTDKLAAIECSQRNGMRQ